MSKQKWLHGAADRNSSFEVLRIVAMVMVVISHASFHGGFPERASTLEFNNHFLNWTILGNLGVNIFILITGYFLCTKQISAKWILRNLTQVWFYSILCGIIHVLTGGSLSAKNLVTIFLPTIFNEYWFFTAYFVLTLLAPYLNLFVENASKKTFQNCLLTAFLLWCVILSFTNQNMYSSDLIRFLMYYLAGAYFKKYPDNCLANSSIRRILAGVSLALFFLSSTVIRLVNENVTYLISETSFTNPFSVLSFGASVGLFAMAVYHKPWKNTYINVIASCTFGVYLLHDNPFLRKTLWQDWIRNALWYDSGSLMIRILFSALAVFIACIPIELLRQRILAKPLLSCAETVFYCLREKVKTFFEKRKISTS